MCLETCFKHAWWVEDINLSLNYMKLLICMKHNKQKNIHNANNSRIAYSHRYKTLYFSALIIISSHLKASINPLFGVEIESVTTQQ
ncbi:hypothetical protein NEQG_01070 [Nematocida parisii ERTm3]|uniref:Uncharacterized protein n=1 Tax=Nematocida parisii (strain ERTm3) TaxID=935791 RepID=I3EGN3_NEMP3|nr:hypothetical protein NEQG_01070 [Nematocida parisii ERTm3]